MSMYIQEIVNLIENQNTPIIIETVNGQESFEANAYMLRRVLHVAEKLSADNIILTVTDETYKNLKNILNP